MGPKLKEMCFGKIPEKHSKSYAQKVPFWTGVFAVKCVPNSIQDPLGPTLGLPTLAEGTTRDILDPFYTHFASLRTRKSYQI